MTEITRRTRGKQKIDPAIRDLHMRRIEDARARLWGAKAEFERRKRAEWEELKATLERDTYQAVWDARDARLIIDDIKHAYGVSNASVIYGVLKARPVPEPEPTNEPEPTDAPYVLTEADDKGEHWLITHNESGAGAWVRKRDLRPTKSVGPGRLALDMVDRQHVAWQYVPKSEENN